eukprot:167840-Amphidinium_carterae.1
MWMYMRKRGSGRRGIIGCTPLPDPPPLEGRDGMGVIRQDYTDGPMVITPARSRRPPWIGTL